MMTPSQAWAHKLFVHGRMEAELGSHFFDGTVFIIASFDQIDIFDQIVMIDQIVNVCDQYYNATHSFFKSLVINASLTFCHFNFWVFSSMQPTHIIYLVNQSINANYFSLSV